MGDMADDALDRAMDLMFADGSDEWEDEGWFVDYSLRLSPPREIEVLEVKATTEKAWLIRFRQKDDTMDTLAWFPKKVCSLSLNKITVPAWLIAAKDLNL